MNRVDRINKGPILVSHNLNYITSQVKPFRAYHISGKQFIRPTPPTTGRNRTIWNTSANYRPTPTYSKRHFQRRASIDSFEPKPRWLWPASIDRTRSCCLWLASINRTRRLWLWLASIDLTRSCWLWLARIDWTRRRWLRLASINWTRSCWLWLASINRNRPRSTGTKKRNCHTPPEQGDWSHAIGKRRYKPYPLKTRYGREDQDALTTTR